MTAMRETSASADPLQTCRANKNSMNDRKFAFLNQVTRPDYRSLPNSAVTSQSSVPSTPITIPLVEQTMFREFGAPIATPEDELLDEIEIKSEPVLSPRRNYTDFGLDSEEKENRDDTETEADTTIREELEDVEQRDEDVRECPEDEISYVNKEEEIEKVIEQSEDGRKNEEIEEVPPEYVAPSSHHEDFIRMVESAPELTSSFHEDVRLTPEEREAEEIRKMTESFGEPRKAVLERLTIEETDDDETETETETEVEIDEEDVDEDVRRQIAAVSRPDDDNMVFGWTGKKEKLEKPTSLPLKYEVEAECSTPRRAEFSMDASDDDVDPSEVTSSADEGVLQQSLLQLQKQLRKTDVRCSRLEKICEFQQRDIDSLRFEVDWKDKRIEYLQKTLQEMEASQTTTITTSSGGHGSTMTSRESTSSN